MARPAATLCRGSCFRQPRQEVSILLVREAAVNFHNVLIRYDGRGEGHLRSLLLDQLVEHAAQAPQVRGRSWRSQHRRDQMRLLMLLQEINPRLLRHATPDDPR